MMESENIVDSLRKLTNFNLLEFNDSSLQSPHARWEIFRGDKSSSTSKANKNLDRNNYVHGVKPSVKQSESMKRQTLWSVFNKDYVDASKISKPKTETKISIVHSAKVPKQSKSISKKVNLAFELKKTQQNILKEQILKEMEEKEAKRKKEKQLIKKKVVPIAESEKKRNLKLREKLFGIVQKSNINGNISLVNNSVSKDSQNNEEDKKNTTNDENDEKNKHSSQDSVTEIKELPMKKAEENEMFKNVSQTLSLESKDKINEFYCNNIHGQNLDSESSKTLQEIVDLISFRLPIEKKLDIKEPQFKIPLNLENKNHLSGHKRIREDNLLTYYQTKKFTKAKEYYNPRLKWISYYWKGETKTLLNLNEVLVFVLPDFLNEKLLK